MTTVFKHQLVNSEAIYSSSVSKERKPYYTNKNWLAHEQFQESFPIYLGKVKQEITRKSVDFTDSNVLSWNKSLSKISDKPEIDSDKELVAEW